MALVRKKTDNTFITWTDSQTMILRSPYTPLPDNIDTTWAKESADADSFGASGVSSDNHGGVWYNNEPVSKHSRM